MNSTRPSREHMEKNTRSQKAPESYLISPRILPHQVSAAISLRRARSRMMVCFWTLPLYVLAIWTLLTNQRDIDAFMCIYMGMWAAFATDMARRRCPFCKKQFYVKHVLMDLRARHCVHCGFDSLVKANLPSKEGTGS